MLRSLDFGDYTEFVKIEKALNGVPVISEYSDDYYKYSVQIKANSLLDLINAFNEYVSAIYKKTKNIFLKRGIKNA